MKLILGAIALVVVLVSIVFAVHNFSRVTIDLWPFPISLDMPLYVVILISVVVGFLVGAVTAWLSAGKWRKLARQRERAVHSLNRQLAAVKDSEPPTLEPRYGSTAPTPRPSRAGAVVPSEGLPPPQR